MTNSTVDIPFNTELEWIGLFKNSPLFGVLTLDKRKKMISANQAAKDILHSNDGLTFNHYRFSASVCGENQQLQQIINESAESVCKQPHATQGGNLLISRPSGKRHYSVQIMPIPKTMATKAPYPTTIVLIQDFDRQPALPIEPMKRLYKLTTTEALVAAKITQGKSLELCAQELGHTISTSRNLLKRVFAKTRTSRQNELVSLLLSSPLSIQPPP